MKFESIVLFVNDIKKSNNFYTRVLNEKIKFDFGANIGYESGLSIWQTDRANEIIFHEKRKTATGNAFEIYYETENINESYAKIKPNVKLFVNDLHEEPWRQKTCRFADPDGHIIELGESMPALIKRLFKTEGKTAEDIVKETTLPLTFVNQIIRTL